MRLVCTHALSKEINGKATLSFRENLNNTATLKVVGIRVAYQAEAGDIPANPLFFGF